MIAGGIARAARLKGLHRVARNIDQNAKQLIVIGLHREAALDCNDPPDRDVKTEAERFVGEAQEYLASADVQLRLGIVLSLAALRIAQEREDEAEGFFQEALAISDEVDFTFHQVEVLRRIIRFLDESGQNGKVATYEERLAVLVPAESAAEIA